MVHVAGEVGRERKAQRRLHTGHAGELAPLVHEAVDLPAHFVPEKLLPGAAPLPHKIEAPQLLGLVAEANGRKRNPDFGHPVGATPGGARVPHGVPARVFAAGRRDAGIDLHPARSDEELVAVELVVVRVNHHPKKIGIPDVVPRRQLPKNGVLGHVVHHGPHVNRGIVIQHTHLGGVLFGAAGRGLQLNELPRQRGGLPLSFIKQAVELRRRADAQGPELPLGGGGSLSSRRRGRLLGGNGSGPSP